MTITRASAWQSLVYSFPRFNVALEGTPSNTSPAAFPRESEDRPSILDSARPRTPDALRREPIHALVLCRPMSGLSEAPKSLIAILGNVLTWAAAGKRGGRDAVPRSSEKHDPAQSDNHTRTLANVSLPQPLRASMLGPDVRDHRRSVTRSKARGGPQERLPPEKLIQNIDNDSRYDPIEV